MPLNKLWSKLLLLDAIDRFFDRFCFENLLWGLFWETDEFLDLLLDTLFILWMILDSLNLSDFFYFDEIVSALRRDLLYLDPRLFLEFTLFYDFVRDLHTRP